MLDTEALAVANLCAADHLDTARQRIRSLVGRATDDRSAGELSRATVESVAENSVDAVRSSLAGRPWPPGSTTR